MTTKNTRLIVIDCKAKPLTLRLFDGRVYVATFEATSDFSADDLAYLLAYVPPAKPGATA